MLKYSKITVWYDRLCVKNTALENTFSNFQVNLKCILLKGEENPRLKP